MSVSGRGAAASCTLATRQSAKIRAEKKKNPLSVLTVANRCCMSLCCCTGRRRSGKWMEGVVRKREGGGDELGVSSTVGTPKRKEMCTLKGEKQKKM